MRGMPVVVLHRDLREESMCAEQKQYQARAIGSWQVLPITIGLLLFAHTVSQQFQFQISA